jgi:hypothetical protein
MKLTNNDQNDHHTEICAIENRFEANFKDMMMTKPERGRLKRSCAPGLNVEYKTSRNMLSLKCCVYSIQV